MTYSTSGPQHNHVEGGEGSDTYFISYHSTHTTVNNFAMDKVDDYLAINRTYESLHVHKVDYHLNVTSMDPEIPLSVIIENWFWSEAFKHMHFKTSDGVIFTVLNRKDGSVLTIPYALIGFQHLDGTNPNYTHVEYIEGTDGDDYIEGNDCENTIVSEGGRSDFFKGGIWGRPIQPHSSHIGYHLSILMTTMLKMKKWMPFFWEFHMVLSQCINLE